MARNVPQSPHRPSTRETLWSSDETGAFLGVSVRTLDDWAYKGHGPRFFRVGRHRRYDPRDVATWLDTRAHGGPDAAA